MGMKTPEEFFNAYKVKREDILKKTDMTQKEAESILTAYYEKFPEIKKHLDLFNKMKKPTPGFYRMIERDTYYEIQSHCWEDLARFSKAPAVAIGHQGYDEGYINAKTFVDWQNGYVKALEAKIEGLESELEARDEQAAGEDI